MSQEIPGSSASGHPGHSMPQDIADTSSVHIVCDNCATHNAPMIMELAAHPTCQVHFTPTGSSYPRRTSLTTH
jgi:hypothetical protein